MKITTRTLVAPEPLATDWLETPDAAQAADVWAHESLTADDEAAQLFSEFDAIVAQLR